MHEKKGLLARFGLLHLTLRVLCGALVSICFFFFSLIFLLNLRHGLRQKGITARSVLSLSLIL